MLGLKNILDNDIQIIYKYICKSDLIVSHTSPKLVGDWHKKPVPFFLTSKRLYIIMEVWHRVLYPRNDARVSFQNFKTKY